MAPLSQVSLYADNENGTPVAVASSVADENGFYSITSTPLADGIQDLEVQAVDPAGNPSPFSSSLEIIVDTAPQGRRRRRPSSVSRSRPMARSAIDLCFP